MSENILQISLFGTLTVALGEKVVSCEQNRSKRMWSLLAYLLYNSRRVVGVEELVTLLWSGDKEDANPQSALKTTVHRLRSVLTTLGDGVGKGLILAKNGGYTINAAYQTEIDVVRFEQLLKTYALSETPEDPTPLMEALALYRGDFCAIQSADAWVIPAATHYRNLYADAVIKAVPLLEKQGRYPEALVLCRRAIGIDPYLEVFYQLLMRVLLAAGQREEVISLYENMSKIFLANFGVMPDQESRALYREALRNVNFSTVSPEMLKEQLTEKEVIDGALLCDFDFFRNIYQASARGLARNGDAIHIVLLTLKPRGDKAVSKKSMETAMDNFERMLHCTLRKGDAVARCSSSQFVVMLPQANFENSVMVSERVITAYRRKYPHQPVYIDHYVQPITPSVDG